VKNFVLLGAAGYVAPRHMKAIKDTGNNLLAVLDRHDAVGILDEYFPKADFFTEYERFDRHIEMLKRNGTTVDYVVICTPNYLHDAHIRFGLRTGADVICEKPLVLNPWNAEGLMGVEAATGRRVYSILQLRLHPAIQSLKQKIDAGNDKVHHVKLNYITARGNWYQYSWKGDIAKSGGIATNIGIHFFDMLQWIFGDVKESTVAVQNEQRAAGELILAKATVSWQLSIDENDIPSAANGKSTWRYLEVDGEAFDFSEGFADLHTKSYEAILAGGGFGLEESLPGIRIVNEIRNKKYNQA